MVGSVAMKAYRTSQYLVRFPLYLITSFSRAFIDSIKLLIVSIRIEYIVFTALCLNCSKDSFVMFVIQPAVSVCWRQYEIDFL